MEPLFFYILAVVTIVSALFVITRKNPVISIIFLLVMLAGMAGLFVMLHAHFIAAIQVLVYAGAIIVLFLFVVMLLSGGDAKPPFFIRSPIRAIAVLLALIVLLEAFIIMSSGSDTGISATQAFNSSPRNLGNTENVAASLFTTYLLPFEIASLVLLVAMIGAIILSKGFIK